MRGSQSSFAPSEWIYNERGLLKEAQVKDNAALVLYHCMYVEKNPRVTTLLYSIADNKRMGGHLEEALKLHNKSLKIRRHILGDDHADVADSMNGIAAVYLQQGKHEEALQKFNEGISIFIRAVRMDHPHVALARFNVALCKERLGDSPQRPNDEIVMRSRLI
jgi:tetratricopeptide (TPR) repeat protein